MQTAILLHSLELPTVDESKHYDVLIALGKILNISETNNLTNPLVDKVYDCSGYIGLPGLVDAHIHILGGGGGDGYRSYVNGPNANDLLRVGITSLIASLGFDSTTRTLTELVRKARTLAAAGLGVRCLIGGFYFPPLTITGDIRQDYVLIPEVVGAGELALGDSRASTLLDNELANYAGACFTGSSLAGKPPILQIHLGDDPKVFSRLMHIAESAKLPLAMFHVTHVNRDEALLTAAAEFAKRGGMIDVTTHLPKLVPGAEAVLRLLELGAPDERITVSTDAFGGMLVGKEYVPSPADVLLACLQELAGAGLPVAQAIKYVAGNAACYFGFPDRGAIAEGMWADILLLDKKTLSLEAVVASGNMNTVG